MHPKSRLTSRQSAPFFKRRRERAIFSVGIALISILAWVYVISRLSWLGVFAVTSVRVYGADRDVSGAVQAAALEALQGSYLGLFSRSNTLVYPHDAMVTAIRKSSARIDDADVRRDGRHGLAITITEKLPAAIVCAELPDFSADLSSNSSSDCYFADEKGFLFQKAPVFSGHIYDRYYAPALADNASSTGLVGSYATSTPEFQALQSFYETVKKNGIKIAGILVKEGGEYELYAENIGNGSLAQGSDLMVIYFNDARPLSDQLINLLSFWNRRVSEARAKHLTLRFDSVDVRYGSNVFFRESP